MGICQDAICLPSLYFVSEVYQKIILTLSVRNNVRPVMHAEN